MIVEDKESLVEYLQLKIKAAGHGETTRICEAAGMPRPTLYKALNEHGNPSIETVFKILRALNLRVEVRE